MQFGDGDGGGVKQPGGIVLAVNLNLQRVEKIHVRFQTFNHQPRAGQREGFGEVAPL